MGEESSKKRGRKPKKLTSDTMDFRYTNPAASSAVKDVAALPNNQTQRLRRGRSRTGEKHVEIPDSDIAASPERETRGLRLAVRRRREVGEPGEGGAGEGRGGNVFCFHTEPNFSMPWQRKRQYSSSSSGFVIGGRRVLTNAHSVEHFTQVQLKKRGSDTKYLARVLAIGTECDIGKKALCFLFPCYFSTVSCR